MALNQEHMNVSVPPEGDEKPPVDPAALETLEDLEEEELIELVRAAATKEELDDVLDRYLDRHQN